MRGPKRRPVVVRLVDKIDRLGGPIVTPELGRCWEWEEVVDEDS